MAQINITLDIDLLHDHFINGSEKPLGPNMKPY